MSWGAIKGHFESVYTSAGFKWRELSAEQVEQLWSNFNSTFVKPSFRVRFEKQYNARCRLRAEWLEGSSKEHPLDILDQTIKDEIGHLMHAAIMWYGPSPSNTAAYLVSGPLSALNRLFPAEGDALAIFFGQRDRVIGCVWKHEGSYLLSPLRSPDLAKWLRALPDAGHLPSLSP